MKSYALSGTSAPAPAQHPPAQDLSRHKPRAAANHLSPLELVKRDAQRLTDDVEAFERMAAPGSPQRPLKPPGRRP